MLALLLFSVQVSVSDVFLADLAQQFLIHQQIQRIIMGANCCKIFSTEKHASPSELQAQLQKKAEELNVKYRTRNDKEFTYFLGVFELRTYAQLLKQPEYMDDRHPRFSPSQFNEAHRQYARVVKELGQYVEYRKDSASAVQVKVKKDASALEEARAKLGFSQSKQRGCLVKLELQGVNAHGIDEIEAHHLHPQKWSGKFQQQIKMKSIQTEPYFVQFAVPEVAGSSLKFKTKPRRLELEVKLDECYNAGKTTFCQVRPWKNGEEGEGLALRIQLFDGLDESDKVRDMAELHKGLQSQFENVGVASTEETADRVERHRSSLNQHYDLNNNSMF